jgi:hypothetical protein
MVSYTCNERATRAHGAPANGPVAPGRQHNGQSDDGGAHRAKLQRLQHTLDSEVAHLHGYTDAF